MTLKMTTNRTNSAEIRRETLESRQYLVAPVIAVREGVLNGELLPADEIGAYVDAWNGIPLPIGHPMDRGAPISANRPDIIQSTSIGRFWNARFDGNRLRGEIWVDISKCHELGGDALTVLNRLENGEPLEVSTAYFSDHEPISGSFNGNTYSSIQRNLRPDHLALLPNEIGACNWEMGCGAPRVNSSEGGDKKVSFFQKLKQSALSLLSTNDVSHDEVAELLEQAMTRETGDAMRFLIRRRFDDYFIYQESTANGFDGRLMRREYSIDDETKKVTLGDAVEVRHVESYEPITPSINNEIPHGKEGKPAAPATNTQSRGEEPVEKEKLIAGLIANSATQFTEQDRVWLETMEEAQLQKLLPTVNSQPNQPEPVKPATNSDCGCKGQPSTNAGQSTVQAEPKTMEQWIQEIPDPETREFMINSQRKQREHREKLVKDLAANSRCAFDEDELKGMSTNALEKLTRSLVGDDYSGIGGPRANSYQRSDDDSIPAPPSVLLANQNKEAK